MTKKSIKNIAVGFITSMVLMMASFVPAYAQAPSGFGIENSSPTAVQNATGQAGGDLKKLVKTIVDFFLTFLGLVAVVMIIYGGFLYVTAAGNQEKIESGKKIIMYAIVGIVVILLSYAIVNTILQAGTGSATAG